MEVSQSRSYTKFKVLYGMNNNILTGIAEDASSLLAFAPESSRKRSMSGRLKEACNGVSLAPPPQKSKSASCAHRRRTVSVCCQHG